MCVCRMRGDIELRLRMRTGAEVWIARRREWLLLLDLWCVGREAGVGRRGVLIGVIVESCR